MGIAVLAEPGSNAPGTEELGDFVSVFQLLREQWKLSRVFTSWYAGREYAVSPPMWVGLRRGGADGPRWLTKRRHEDHQWCLFRKGMIIEHDEQPCGVSSSRRLG